MKLAKKIVNELFKEVMVWKRVDSSSAIRYSCLNDLQNDAFAVQSADFFRLPFNMDSANDFAKQFAEFLIEVSPRERCSWFDSIEEAIANHERAFS